ncbi:hypothetical protein OsI_13527 [Oryza sativa Indica Group]|uniref:C-terminal of Roc (COR) domain-containing protein n=1 Tax=Oryza sativa subsp. indica TaxID=39946 RepID=B8AJX0_ORYSI|nr:hypothetical protein OsI_13527 [Oryza sativa Indica Group]
MGDKMITRKLSFNQKDMDVTEIDLQDYKDVDSIAFYQVPTNVGSGMSMESERLVRVHACTDHNGVSFLHKLLHRLLEHKEMYSNVVNLLFHGIEWQTEGVQLLCSFLGPGSSVKQVEFQKNVFGTKSSAALVPLSEMIQRNNTIKAIVFSECRIGASGVKLLASALAYNRSVEEVQLLDDSIGAKGAEEFSKMIEVNCVLKLLVILDNSSIAAAPIFSAVLARSRRVEVHVWGHCRDTRGGMNSCKIAEFQAGTGSLRIYNNINSTGLQRIACAMAWNTTVTTLDMSGVPLKSKWTKELRGVLERNRMLKTVKLTKCCLRDKAVVYIAAGLFKNSYLESLSLDGNRFGGVGLEHLLCPLSTFSPLQRQANLTLKVLSFGGRQTNIGRYGITAILQMLETNQSLLQLAICDDVSLRPNDVVRIFTSLERNTTLRNLSLKGCRGVEGELVLQTIMGMLQVNPWIEEIDLHETPLHVAGKTREIYEKLGQNGSSVVPNDLLDLPLSAPTCCQVFLCGQELSGKSTLCSSIKHCMNSMKLPRMDEIRTSKTPIEQMSHTNEYGMNIIFDGNTKLTMCNIGGPEESIPLHDFMFVVHGGPRIFMIVSSLIGKPADKYPKSIDVIEQELIYWLKFVASNSRRRVSHSFIPCVTIVLTHYDKVSHLAEGLQLIVAAVQRLREDFCSYAEIYPTVFVVDSRSQVSVSKLTHHLRNTTKTVLQQAPQVYEVCNDLIRYLHNWRLKNDKSVVKWSEFCEICQLSIPVLRLRSRHDNAEKLDTRRHAVAKSLHDLGEIIFFEELGVLIMNCEWFCQDILSQLGALKSIKIENSGFVRKQDLEKILQEKLCNQIQRSTGELVHPCPLVRLHNKIMCPGNQQGAVYNLEKNLIYTVIDGVHVRVELGMKLGSSIDVLACSTRNVTDMDLKEEIARLRYYEYHLVTELHRKMDYVMNYSIQLEDRKVPQLFYLVSLDSRSKKLVTRILPGMRSLRVHMLCEFRQEMHVLEDQVGCDLIQVDNRAVQSLLPYMSKFMKLLTFALKIGAHFIVGMGEMIPDLSREVVHLLDSSVMYGATTSALSLGALGAAAMYGKARNNGSQSGTNDMEDDMKTARQWLVDFLKGQGILTGMDIAQRFGLWRVRYRDDGHIAWICRKHIVARADEIFELPL